jgi:hypothetical protein
MSDAEIEVAARELPMRRLSASSRRSDGVGPSMAGASGIGGRGMSVAASIVAQFTDAHINPEIRKELIAEIDRVLHVERECNARTARVIGRQASARTSPIDVAEHIAKAIEIPF